MNSDCSGVFVREIFTVQVCREGLSKNIVGDDPPPERCQRLRRYSFSPWSWLYFLLPNVASSQTPFGLVRVDRRSADSGNEEPARGERLVTDHPERHAESRPHAEKPILGVAFGETVRNPRRLPISGARQQQSDEMLGVPAGRLKLGGEPVDQFRMDRPLSWRPKSSGVFTWPIPKNCCRSD